MKNIRLLVLPICLLALLTLIIFYGAVIAEAKAPSKGERIYLQMEEEPIDPHTEQLDQVSEPIGEISEPIDDVAPESLDQVSETADQASETLDSASETVEQASEQLPNAPEGEETGLEPIEEVQKPLGVREAEGRGIE